MRPTYSEDMRLSRLRPSLAAAATSAMLLGGLAACGSDSGTATDEPEVSSQEQGSEVDAADLPDEGETVDNGEFVDWMMAGLDRSTTAHMTMSMDYGGGAMEAEGQVDYTTTPVSMAMTLGGEAMGTGDLDMRLVDGVMYMNMGQMSNDKFFKFDLSDPDSLPPGMEDLGDQMDPLAAFKEFEPALEQVVYVGSEDVDGDDLDHFTITMDTAKIPSLAEVPAGAGLPDTVDYDMWFDEDFRVRQMNMAMDMGAQTGTTVDVEAKLFDWDEPVEIVAPDPDQISDAPMGGAAAG